MKDFTFFAVKEFVEVSNETEQHVEELFLDGYTVVENVLDEEDVALARKKIDKIYQQQIDELGGDESVLGKIKDSNFARCLLAYDDFFLTEIAANKKVLQIINSALGDYYILMLQNAILNKPYRQQTSNACAFHRDLNYQHFTSSRPLSISALFCIDDFTEENGATRVLPYTHKLEKCPSESYIEKHQKPVMGKAGSVIIFDSMMYHCAGKNTSDEVRRAVNNMYVLPFIKQQISIPAMLNGRFSDHPFYKRFLGYESEAETDVLSFRQKRIERVP
jgi:ectoine hydroxylase-related dioxygenase (phytanoyl-CoA dioxygenase family)